MNQIHHINLTISKLNKKIPKHFAALRILKGTFIFFFFWNLTKEINKVTLFLELSVWQIRHVNN